MQLPAFLPGSTTLQFSAVYKKLADKFNMAFVPFFQAGVHPSVSGYQVIAENT